MGEPFTRTTGQVTDQLIHQDDFRTQCPHHARSLHGITPGHHRYEGVPLDAAHDCQPRPGIAAGKFDHGLARRQSTRGFGIGNNLAGDAVLL